MEQSIPFSQLLYEYTCRFADLKSNPTLYTLRDHLPIRKSTKYPPGHMTTYDGMWRAFYHCHDSPINDTNEHGHFHIFWRILPFEKDEWAHVVCLSMNPMGQPLNWILLNRWVTDGVWLNVEMLNNSLRNLTHTLTSNAAKLGIVEGWLLTMLGFYHQEIAGLYLKRDETLTRLSDERNTLKLREDRSIYQLAIGEINLIEKIAADMSK